MVSFTYNLTSAGNAEAVVADGARQATFLVSYLSDALRDLTVAIIALLEGAKSSDCTWFAEPGEYSWSFTRRGEGVWIRVIGFRDWEPERNKKDLGRVLFKASCPLKEFAHVVLQEVERLYTEVGPSTYKELWVAHNFPVAEYMYLRNLLRHGN